MVIQTVLLLIASMQVLCWGFNSALPFALGLRYSSRSSTSLGALNSNSEEFHEKYNTAVGLRAVDDRDTQGSSREIKDRSYAASKSAFKRPPPYGADDLATESSKRFINSGLNYAALVLVGGYFSFPYIVEVRKEIEALVRKSHSLTHSLTHTP
jgi:hypothetical protein